MSSDRRQVDLNGRIYEWDGADWWCVTGDHDGTALDDAIVLVEQLRAALEDLIRRVRDVDMLAETWSSDDMVALIQSVRLKCKAALRGTDEQ